MVDSLSQAIHQHLTKNIFVAFVMGTIFEINAKASKDIAYVTHEPYVWLEDGAAL